MRAIVITSFGGPEVLQLRDVPEPKPERSEVLVRIKATAVNRADLMQRMGTYPAPEGAPADIPGLEFAGIVEALGTGVSELAVGDRVLGLAGGGTYAEKLVVHARTIAKMPDSMSFTDAAAIPEAFITAWDAMITQARLAPGESVLIHAVGSGVGTAAVQIARAIGARSIGTARAQEKIDRARGLGLDEGLVVRDGHFAKEVAAFGGADVVLELVGGDYVREDIECARPKGRIVVVGLLAGRSMETDLGALLGKRLTMIGTVLRARPLEEKIAAAQMFQKSVVPLFARGLLRPVVDRVLPLESAVEAHRAMAANEGFGKLVLEVG